MYCLRQVQYFLSDMIFTGFQEQMTLPKFVETIQFCKLLNVRASHLQWLHDIKIEQENALNCYIK